MAYQTDKGFSFQRNCHVIPVGKTRHEKFAFKGVEKDQITTTKGFSKLALHALALQQRKYHANYLLKCQF